MPFSVDNLHEFGPQDLPCAENIHDEDGQIITDEAGNPLCAESVANTSPFTMEITLTSTFPPFEIEHRNIGISGALIYDYVVDWGDGQEDHITSYNQAELAHSYSSTGTYTVTCMGQMESINFPSGSNPEIRKVLSWGRTGFKYLQGAFRDCYLMTIHEATDLPDFSICETVVQMFYECRAITSGAENWSFQGALTSIRMLFDHCDYFDSDCSNWNTTGITDMYGVFNYCQRFNSSVANMDTSAVTNMQSMFFFCDKFNDASIVNFDVSACTNFINMFGFAQDLTQDIGGWAISTTSGAISMNSMFRSADLFNVDLNSWDVSEVTDFANMFQDAFDYDQDHNLWDMSKATTIQTMFNASYGIGVFNGNIDNWVLTNCTNMRGVFSGQNLFNRDISGWDVDQVTNFSYMFQNCNIFNQNIGGWTINTTSGSSVLMQGMFVNAIAFNQDISGWDISEVTGFYTTTLGFLGGATAFNTTNYDLLLNAWSLLTVQPTLRLDVNATYTIATSQAARDILTNTPNFWTINDSGGI